MIVATEDADVVALSVRLAQQRLEHDDPDDLEGRRRSREAFRRWREKIPKELCQDADLDILVRRHRDYWLRSAESLVRTLDPYGLGTGDVHAIDFEDLGIQSERLSGFAFPGGGFFDIVCPLLRRTARPGPVVAVNVREEARQHSRRVLDHETEWTIRATVRVGISGTVLHEIAHSVDHEVAGRRFPDGVTLDDIRLVSSRPAPKAVREDLHGSRWVRLFAHVVDRASRVPPSDYWGSLFGFDVSQHYSGNAEDFLDALSGELATTSPNEPLADIVKRPAPPAFSQLIESRGKSRTNEEKSK